MDKVNPDVVAILSRFLFLLNDGLEASGKKCEIDIVYDTPLRNVFLRSGIALYDNIDHMKQRAMELMPSHPDSLDLPCWLIGRKFCHTTNPDCDNCWITNYCAKRI